MTSTNPAITAFFCNLSALLQQHITPIAHHLDQDAALLQHAYQQLTAIGGLALLVPENCGGIGGERSERIAYNVLMAQHTGALLFLDAQHQHAVTHLKKFLPNPKVAAALQAACQQAMGLALAANRNILGVQPTATGFALSGQLRWVTGFGYFSHILLSFDHEQITFYTLLPFTAAKQNNCHIAISPPIETAVFRAANTVSVTLENWPITHAQIIVIQPTTIRTPSEHPTIYTFAGVIKALLDIATTQGKYADQPEIAIKLAQLEMQWQDYYDRVIVGTTCPLTLRAEGWALAETCATLARLACGSDTLLAKHPVARISREIWQYTVAGLSLDQLRAYLAKQSL